MMHAVRHFGSISGGKDSQAVLCKMVERIEREGLETFGIRAPRVLAADTGHENPITLDHIAYLDDWLRRRIGLNIEMVSANDVPGLTDDAAFARKRAMLREEWSKEKRRTRHKGACNRRRDAWQAGAITRAEWRAQCDCPVMASPPVADHLIERALELPHPTGIPFLDVTMLHGRATIDKAIDWSRTGRDGRSYDLLIELEQPKADEDGLFCDSEYGLCE